MGLEQVGVSRVGSGGGRGEESASTYDGPKDYYRALRILYATAFLLAAELWPAREINKKNLKLHCLVTTHWIRTSLSLLRSELGREP